MAQSSDSILNHQKNSGTSQGLPAAGPNSLPRDPELEEFVSRFSEDLLRSDPPEGALAAAFEAMQRLSVETDAEDSAETFVPDRQDNLCQACGSKNRPENRFCSTCGVALTSNPGACIAPERRAKDVSSQPEGSHHYHHHYHHHYFSSPDGALATGESRPIGSSGAARQQVSMRAPLTGPALSRAELAVRKMAQDWALACNTKQLEDLVDLYIADALIMRPNIPAIRGMAAIREFFVTLLDSGFGEVELEPLRVEVLGDVAYEAGRCKMLVPMTVGKRREDRGKYQMIYARHGSGDWKIVSDSWSIDLGLAVAAEGEAAASAGANPHQSRPTKK